MYESGSYVYVVACKYCTVLHAVRVRPIRIHTHASMRAKTQVWQKSGASQKGETLKLTMKMGDVPDTGVEATFFSQGG